MKKQNATHVKVLKSAAERLRRRAKTPPLTQWHLGYNAALRSAAGDLESLASEHADALIGGSSRR